MGIFSRLGDILSSNLNALLDKAEDPAKIIRQIILEMEDTLVEARTNAARLLAERKELERRLARLERDCAEWESRAELALSREREDLARAALVEKAKLADQRRLLEAEREELDATLAKVESDITQLQAKLNEARAKQNSLASRMRAAGNRRDIRRVLGDGRLEDAIARFDQMERRLDDLSAEAEAYDLGRKPGLAEEIESLAVTQAVDEDLARLKAKLGRSGGGSGQQGG
ncbi:MAG TPA: phage shock protein PspA [Candidatus Competibacteraceae bacterium]|nr:phage shock protein PspA [Candidatus Competibacteraceae bacterium]